MIVSVSDAMNSIRDWDLFQDLMRLLRRYRKQKIYYIPHEKVKRRTL